MDYASLKDLAFNYADRTDLDDRFDDFLKIVESRINQYLRVKEMSGRYYTATVEDQIYYDLPSDFRGIRHISLYNSPTPKDRTTLTMLNPEQFAERQHYDDGGLYYTLIGGEIQISPTQPDGLNLEIVYYMSVPALTTTNTTNWLTERYPDVYLFGLLVEISSYAKDAEAKMIWEDRYLSAIASVTNEDAVDRWSGPTLQVRTA